MSGTKHDPARLGVTRHTPPSTPIAFTILAVGVAVPVSLTYLGDQPFAVGVLFAISLAYSLEKWTFALFRRAQTIVTGQSESE